MGVNHDSDILDLLRQRVAIRAARLARRQQLQADSPDAESQEDVEEAQLALLDAQLELAKQQAGKT